MTHPRIVIPMQALVDAAHDASDDALRGYLVDSELTDRGRRVVADELARRGITRSRPVFPSESGAASGVGAS